MEEENQKFSGRRENRAAAMQFLYMMEANPNKSLEDSLSLFFETKENPRSNYAFAEELIAGVVANLEKVDAEIKERAANWSVERIARVDLAILRLAIFELLFREDIPPVVSINEAIDLSKSYSGAESRRFVNGILDSVKNSLSRPLRTPKKK